MRCIQWSGLFLGSALLLTSLLWWGFFVLALVSEGIIFLSLACWLLHIVLGILRPPSYSTPLYPALRGCLILLAFAIFYCDYIPLGHGGWVLIIIPPLFFLLGLIENLHTRRSSRPHRPSKALPILNLCGFLLLAAATICNALSPLDDIYLVILGGQFGGLLFLSGILEIQNAIRSGRSDAAGR